MGENFDMNRGQEVLQVVVFSVAHTRTQDAVGERNQIHVLYDVVLADDRLRIGIKTDGRRGLAKRYEAISIEQIVWAGIVARHNDRLGGKIDRHNVERRGNLTIAIAIEIVVYCSRDGAITCSVLEHGNGT